MKPRTVLALSIAVVASMSAILTSAEGSDDQIIASFEREFLHKTVPARPVTREAIDGDMLYRFVNTPLQTSAYPTDDNSAGIEGDGS